MPNEIRVEGLADLSRRLKQSGDTELPKALKAANKRAAEIVAADAMTRAPVVSGRLRNSIRALGQAKSSTVKGGTARVPYFGWIDYGGFIRFKKRTGGISRPFLKGGRILYPALHASYAAVMAVYQREIKTLTDRL